MDNKKIDIVMLCSQGLSSRIMYNGLAQDFNVLAMIIENKPSASHMLKRRVKKLGLLKVVGQLLFIAFDRCFLQRQQKKRMSELIQRYRLNTATAPDSIVEKVDNINSEEVINSLQHHNPDAVVVNGTRIISPAILSCINKPFLNTHVGITPRYRGVHGAYWALASQDATHCGVTVHLVDSGIDTGGVLYQDNIAIEKNDGFNTYPIHQIAKAIRLMQLALIDAGANSLKPGAGAGPSQLWSHPTLFEYLKNRILLGVK